MPSLLTLNGDLLDANGSLLSVDSDFQSGTITPTSGDSLVIPVTKLCTGVLVWCAQDSGTNYCSQYLWYDRCGSIMRWRSSYGTPYGATDYGSTTFTESAITISNTQTNAPFLTNRTYHWIAW